MSRWNGRWFAVGVLSLAALGSACDLATTCTTEECIEARFIVIMRGPDVELPSGPWVVSANIEDGTFETTCQVGGQDDGCEPGVWSVMPTRDLDARVDVLPSFVEAGERVDAEAQLTVRHADEGPDRVEIAVEIDAAPPLTAAFSPTYTPNSTGDKGCPVCPGTAREVLMLEP